MSLKCSKCGSENQEHALFCGECGTILSGFTASGIGAATHELPMVSFPQAIRLGFSNYFKFNGRSRRSEFWWWFLFALITDSILTMVSGWARLPLSPMFSLGIMIPGLALGARRLHDINRTGWWQLMWLGSFLIIPPIVLMVWATRHGDAGPNIHGHDPRQAS